MIRVYSQVNVSRKKDTKIMKYILHLENFGERERDFAANKENNLRECEVLYIFTYECKQPTPPITQVQHFVFYSYSFFEDFFISAITPTVFVVSW